MRREFRGRGIAQALLADAMRRFAAAGMEVASLDVDSENPTGALALYVKMGYAAVNTQHGVGQGTLASAAVPSALRRPPRWTPSDALAIHVVQVMDDVVQEVLRKRQDGELRAVAAGALAVPVFLRDAGEGGCDLLALGGQFGADLGRVGAGVVLSRLRVRSWSQSSNRASSSVSMRSAGGRRA